MLYNDFKECRLSALGLGCMRFPVLNETDDQIDVAKTEEIVDYALKNGINYFDTAWRYHSGNSETVIGQILSKYPRDSFFLATKFPGFSPEMFEKGAEIFKEQLRKCQVEYFDFYLLHNVSEKNIDNFTNKEIGVVEYLIEQKRLGKIKHLGFSTHGSLRTIRRFLDTYGSELEFCQIQLNYLDWQLQNAKAKVELIQSYGLSVWVMEPVRGGRLAVLPAEKMQRLQNYRPNETAPGWAFRFLQTVPGVKMVLSGMSNMQQLQENIETFSTAQPLQEEELAVISDIAAEMIRDNAIPCTGCSYCTEYCPQEIKIPHILQLYNEKDWSEKPECIGCKSCENVCPQGISIAAHMQAYNAHRT